MFNKIKNPPIPYSGDSFFEEAKYLLTYRLSLFLSFSLGLLLTLFILFSELQYIITTGLAFFSILICHIIIAKTGRFKVIILIFNLLVALLCISSLYLLPNTPHIPDTLWMMVSIVFAYLTVSVIWSTIIAFTHTTFSVLFYYFNYNHQIKVLAELSDLELIGLSINIFFGFSILTYLIWQNIKVSKVAEKKLRDANKSLKSNNDEISLMLKEIHHRVKNNLQVIISLLRLQANELKNEEAIEKFNDSINRVLSMSAIHEKMYQSTKLTKLDLNDYFLGLGKHMIHSHFPAKNVDLKINCEIETSDLNTIVPIGLLFNELISNSLKHAFESSESASIQFSMIRDKKNLTILYSDSGKWKKNENNSSFGTDLIETLVEQLNGTMKLSTEPTLYTFSFEDIEL